MGMKAQQRRSAIIRTIFLAALATIYMVPFLMMILGSFKTQGEALLFDLKLPEEWQFSNYAYVFEKGNVLRSYMNSIITTVGTVVITLITGSFAGIVISRRTTRTSSHLYYFFLFGLTISMQMVTTFALLQWLKLYGTYTGVILVFVASNLPLTIMTISSFVNSVPKEIDEAAIIDGSTPVVLFTRILIPIMKPIMITNLILIAINTWNNFMIPLYFFNSSKKWTIPLTVYNFYGQFSRNWHYVFAALIITIIPVVLLYLFLQKYIVEGMTSGAVKG